MVERPLGADDDRVVIRPYVEGDERVVIELLAASLGKVADESYASFFRWKHMQNPFGASFAWVAEVDGQVAGFRTLLRWRFERDGALLEAVRAVDTATHPAHRGAGIFRRLTEHAVAELERADIDFIFNTPNDQSRPGYLKMGWQVVGRAPVQFRPRAMASLRRMGGARAPAALWSTPTDVGSPAGEALADERAVSALLSGCRDGRLRTARSAAHLRWRYAGYEPVSYRALGSLTEGLILFRLRARGTATELTVGDVLVPAGEEAQASQLIRSAMRQTQADYALTSCPQSQRLSGFVASGRVGPVLTWRHAAQDPDDFPGMSSWALTMGDLELF